MCESITVALSCRWVGYDKERKQCMPCYENGAIEVPPTTEGHQYPAGLLTEDDTVPRAFWTLEDTTVPDTWATGNSLKFTEKELVDRAFMGDYQAVQAALDFPMVGVDGTALRGKERMAMYEKYVAYLNDKHLDLGCKGTPVFAQLSYFRCVLQQSCMLNVLVHANLCVLT